MSRQQESSIFSAAPSHPPDTSLHAPGTGPSSHQRSAAQQDHEDDEGLKPAVLHDLVAGLPQSPPCLAQSCRCVDVTAQTLPNTHWGREGGINVGDRCWYSFTDHESADFKLSNEVSNIDF